jgi:hypothetical protein
MIILSIRPCGTSRVHLHAVKSYDMGPSRFTSHPRGRCARICIALKNPSPWPIFEPATFGSSGQRTNHYTTKATYSYICICISNSCRSRPRWSSGSVLAIGPKVVMEFLGAIKMRSTTSFGEEEKRSVPCRRYTAC